MDLTKINAKKVYTKWAMRIVMPQVAQISQQPEVGEHSLEETKKVIMLGIDLAMHLDKNPVPIILAAALYQCGYDKDAASRNLCGAFSLPIAQKFLERKIQKKLSDAHITQILKAILYHEFDKTIPWEDNYVAACLWDADRTLKAWNGKPHQQFSTDLGKKYASFTKEEQALYLDQQESFLNACVNTSSTDKSVETPVKPMENVLHYKIVNTLHQKEA